MKILSSIILITWLILGIFFGVGGLTKLNSDEILENLQKNQADLIQKKFAPIEINGVQVSDAYHFKVLNERTGIEQYFNWTTKIPQFTSLIATAMSFGLLGAVISQFKELSVGNTNILKIKCLSLPILGMLTGVVVLGLSYLLPTLITKGSNEIRPITLMFLCLFCGISTKKFYEKIETSFDNLFSKK